MGVFGLLATSQDSRLGLRYIVSRAKHRIRQSRTCMLAMPFEALVEEVESALVLVSSSPQICVVVAALEARETGAA